MLDNTTNFVESLNACIEKFRHQPIVPLLKHIRKKFMFIMDKRSEAY